MNKSVVVTLGGPDDAGNKFLNDLHSQPGVTGTCLQAGTSVLAHDLPYSDERVDDFAVALDHLCESYATVDRSIWQIFFGFESHWVLVLTRDVVRLTILLKPETDPALVASRATRMLMDLELNRQEPAFVPIPTPALTPAVSAPAPVVPGGIPKAHFEDTVVSLLGRVAGHAQAQKLVQRQMEKEKAEGLDNLDPSLARRVGLAVLDFIPNRSKRSALASELLATLKL